MERSGIGPARGGCKLLHFQAGLPMEVLIFDEGDYDGIHAVLDLPGPVPVTLAFDASGK